MGIDSNAEALRLGDKKHTRPHASQSDHLSDARRRRDVPGVETAGDDDMTDAEIEALKAEIAALRAEVAQLRSSFESHVARGSIGTFHGFPRKGDAGDIADWCVLPFHSKKHTDELHNVITRIIFWVKTWHHMKGDRS